MTQVAAVQEYPGRRRRDGRVHEPMIEAVARDPGAREAVDYAVRKLRRAASLVEDHVLHVRVTLSTAGDPAVERPALAKATVDVNGHLVRAHVAARTMTEAIDLLDARLRRRLVERVGRARALHRLAPVPVSGQGTRGRNDAARPGHHVRPAGERRIVRRKALVLDELTVDEAALDMDMLDHDFHLFRELATDADVLLVRAADGRYRLRRLRVSPAAAAGAVVDVEVDAELAPSLTVDEAVEWLAVTGDGFVFFADEATGRGSVLYRRYDGHYGLVAPAADAGLEAAPTTVRRRLRHELERLESVRAALATGHFDEETEGESISEISSVDQHPADIGTETFEREKDLSLLAEVEDELADVHRALVRLDRGTYGSCEACGRRIPDERLAARPASRFCVEHQAACEITAGIQYVRRPAAGL